MPRGESIDIKYVIAPRSVAVIGASEDYRKFGGRIFHHLIKHGYSGDILPVNPNRDTILGLNSYKSISDLPVPPDLALLAVPAHLLEQSVLACGQAGVGACVVITAQLGEFSEEGAAIEARIVAIARAHNMRIIGPNCMGMIIPSADLALSSTPTLDYAHALPKGKVAFISQSGAMMGTLFLQAYDHGVGLSGMVSIGNQADLELCDFFEGYIADTSTKVICLYVEGLKSPQRFRDLCEQAHVAGKIVLAVKAGRTEAGAKMAMSHTASLAGSFSAFETLCRETGVLLMDDPDSMILCAGVLSTNPSAALGAAGLVCASGGGAAIMADQLSLRGLEANPFSTDGLSRLAKDYPPSNHNNPLDLGGHLGGLEFGIFERATTTVYEDGSTGVFVYVMTPQPLMRETLEQIIALWERGEKPVVLVFNLSHFGEDLRKIILSSGMPFLTRVDDLFRVLDLYSRLADSHSGSETALVDRPANLALSQEIVSGFQTEPQAKAIQKGYGMVVPQSALVSSEDDACRAAETFGFPVVLKGVVPGLVHKSDAGLVKIGLADQIAVRAAFQNVVAAIETVAPNADVAIDVQQMVGPGIELIVGITREPGYGPQLIIGAGGIYVELLSDVVQARAPVSPKQVKDMLKSLRIWPLMNGVRGQDRVAIDDACMQISNLSWMGEDLGSRLVDFEINPFRVTPDGAFALDGRGTIKAP